MPSSNFTRDTRVYLGHVRDAIRRRALYPDGKFDVWQIPGHGYPTVIWYLFVDYDSAGNWKSAIQVGTGRHEMRVHDEFASKLDDSTYLYSKEKTRLSIVVQVPEGSSKSDLRAAERQASRLVRGLMWDAHRIAHERKDRSAPLDCVPLASNAALARRQAQRQQRLQEKAVAV